MSGVTAFDMMQQPIGAERLPALYSDGSEENHVAPSLWRLENHQTSEDEESSVVPDYPHMELMPD